MFYDVVWFSCEQLHLEEPKLCIDCVKLIHHGLDAIVFLCRMDQPPKRLNVNECAYIQDYFTDNVLVREVFIIEV